MNHIPKINPDIYKKIVDFSPSPTLITDTSGTIVYVNEEFCIVTGYSRDEVLGRQPNILKSGQHPDEFYRELWETLESGNIWAGEICNRSKSGKRYWEREIIIPLRGETNTIDWYVSFRLDDMDRRAAEALKNIQELAGGVAHEFAQPLQVLTIMASLLEMHPDRTEYINTIQSNVKRITGLVNSLKNITTIRKRDYFSDKIVDLHASAESTQNEVAKPALLIVEDEEELRHILMEGLQFEGYACSGAENAETALSLLKENAFKCIISDINMPDINGIQLYKQVYENSFHGKFIFMTGYGLDETMKRVVNQADGILFKPFQLSDLMALLDRLSLTA